jgi:hypothetical protein
MINPDCFEADGEMAAGTANMISHDDDGNRTRKYVSCRRPRVDLRATAGVWRY